MRTAVWIALPALVPAIASAASWSLTEGDCAGGETAAEIVLSGVRSDAGDLVVTVYGDRPEEFLAKGTKLAKLAVPARSGAVTACLTLPRAATYALTVFHDEDRSGRLSRGFLGLPVEGFAFPHDPRPILGPPSFAEVAIAFPDGVTRVPMSMRYP